MREERGERSLQEESASGLEWGRLLDVLAGQAQSAMGVERCQSLGFETDIDAARTRLRETAEMAARRESVDPFPSLAFPDLRGALGRAVKGLALDPRELRDLSIVLELSDAVTAHLDRHREGTPALSAVAARLADWTGELSPLRAAIDRSVASDGSLKETATPELHRLIHQAKGLKQAMRDRLDAILSSERYAEVLQERYFAERENRYVIPVKAEMRTRVPGIVHDVSASGATVFLEPRELVDLNNSIKVAELSLEREIKRILQELSALVGNHEAAVRDAMEVLADLDCISAKASLGRMIGGRPIELNDRGRIVLRQARHPLLLLARGKIVPNDVVMEEGVSVLVISGPNTGGKTVTLKLVGLFALMVRAGIEPPCGANSEMTFFPAVYADIGDAQDLTRDLSSFSAHMTKMVRLLAEVPRPRAQARGTRGPPSALVLLDEVVASTDPVEGAALAEALLARLASLGMKAIVTTHYNSLKALAQTTPGFMNASMEFDASTLSPSYRLILGAPGGSSAIEIAGRLGMDEEILEQAVGLMGRGDRLLDRTMRDLTERQSRLDQEIERVAALRAEAERDRREAAEIAERLKLAEREERKKAKAKLADEVQQARLQVRDVVESLKRERTELRVKEARARLAEIDRRAKSVLVEPGEATPASDLKQGDRVRILGLGTAVKLLESPAGKKRVRVRLGEAELSVLVSELAALTGAPGEEGEAELRKARTAGRPRSSAQPVEDVFSGVVDARGQTADEALESVIATLDRAVLVGVTRVRIIHGHGTGRLKTVLRDYLKTSPYVASFRPGDRNEGGDGVTIVDLR